MLMCIAMTVCNHRRKEGNVHLFLYSVQHSISWPHFLYLSPYNGMFWVRTLLLVQFAHLSSLEMHKNLLYFIVYTLYFWCAVKRCLNTIKSQWIVLFGAIYGTTIVLNRKLWTHSSFSTSSSCCSVWIEELFGVRNASHKRSVEKI